MSLLSKYDPYNTSLCNSENKEYYLSTGCSNLDEFLKGGLFRRGITQIYGASGIGKTQLALQLCLTAQIRSNSLEEICGAAYICTEAAFPSSRLKELLEKSPIVKKHPNVTDEMIFIEHITNTEDLEGCIFNPDRLSQLLSKHKIRLLIIDSIAATYRVEYEADSVQKRAKSLRHIGYRLHQLASLHSMAVVCLNQVTAIIGNSSLESVSTKEQPSLGITWANLVTNSFYMYKRCNRRYFYVAGSSYLPCKSIEYEIVEFGLRALKF